jgi:mannosyltransferase
MQEHLSRPRDRAPLQPLGLFLVGFGVSLLGSWRPSLWTDEAATISAAGRSLPQLLAMAGTIDAVHATYYAFMHGWLSVFPATELWLRLPSGLAVGLTTVGVWLVASRIDDRPEVATLAALAFAILPRTTWMGVEARPYAFSALLAVVSTLLLVLLVAAARADPAAAPSVPRLLLYGGAAALGIAVNIYLALLLVAHGMSLLLDRGGSWRLRRRWLAAAVLAVAVTSPVVWFATHQTGQLGGGDFGVGRWVQNVVVNQWFLGETPTVGTGPAATSSLPFPASVWKPAAVGLALVCWGVIAFGALRGRAAPLLWWALPWAVVPTLVIGLYSVAVHDVYNPRYFSYATPAIALLIGHGLSQLGRRWAVVAVAGLVVLLSVPVYASQRTAYAKSSTDWSGVAAFVEAHRGPGQGVYYSPRYPISGPLVGQTARGVRVAYPEAFDGLLDVTLLRTPVQDHNLSGTSRLLADSTDQLARVSAVWVVRRNDYRYAEQDDRTLGAAGFRMGRTWQGPLDRVLEFTRAE